MELRMPGTNLLYETKKEAEESVDKKKRYQEILEILTDFNKPMTAKEIAVEMYRRGYVPTTERNFSSPRITELLKMGSVDCIGKKKCEYTGKTVGVFVIRRELTND